MVLGGGVVLLHEVARTRRALLETALKRGTRGIPQGAEKQVGDAPGENGGDDGGKNRAKPEGHADQEKYNDEQQAQGSEFEEGHRPSLLAYNWGMPRLLLFLAILGVAVIIYALIDCVMTRSNEVRSISKPAWLITIIVVPLIGAGLWFLFGRARPARRSGPSRPEPRHPTAPDDDPQFLQNLETKRRQQAREQELRRKEQELKAREAQAKGGAKGGAKGTGSAGTPKGADGSAGTPAPESDDDAGDTGSTGAHQPKNP